MKDCVEDGSDYATCACIVRAAKPQKATGDVKFIIQSCRKKNQPDFRIIQITKFQNEEGLP